MTLIRYYKDSVQRVNVLVGVVHGRGLGVVEAVVALVDLETEDSIVVANELDLGLAKGGVEHGLVPRVRVGEGKLGETV